MSTRDAVLRSVRQALGDVEAPGRPVASPPTRRLEGDLAELLCDRLRDYSAEVVRVPSDGVGRAVAAQVARLGLMSVAVPDGLTPTWRPDGVRVLVDGPDVPAAALECVDAALTACSVAIAESGTLVLAAGPRTGRRLLTLLPDCHICVVDVSQVVGTVPDAFASLHPDLPLTFVSGPSATSDIELKRVEGVHGPRRLVVLLTECEVAPSHGQQSRAPRP